jgi:hypothetical protein
LNCPIHVGLKIGQASFVNADIFLHVGPFLSLLAAIMNPRGCTSFALYRTVATYRVHLSAVLFKREASNDTTDLTN